VRIKPAFDVALEAPRAHLTFSEFTRYVRCHGFAETKRPALGLKCRGSRRRISKAWVGVVNEKDETLAD
jgi:hypothetical protein